MLLSTAYKTLKKVASILTMVTYTMLVLSPTASAVRAEVVDTANTAITSKKSLDAELSDSFRVAIEKLALLKQLRTEGKSTDTVLNEIAGLESKIISLDTQIRGDFIERREDLIDKQLPAVILGRHDDFVEHYESRYVEFMNLLETETDTGLFAGVMRQARSLFTTEEVKADGVPGTSIGGFSVNDFKRSQQEFDPNNLPNRTLKPDPNNIPKTTKDEFISSGLVNSPALNLAALGDFKFDQLQGATDPAYLAESDEVVLTQLVRDKAAELEHDPVKIYHWVRNNVEWLPSWGAIQNSDLTLGSQKGNAMDIASLTIALLRASGIPARYVHGTIDVEKDRYVNWVGDFDNVQAAGDFSASGGIPITSLSSGGQIFEIRLEHVWVEAAIDFHPSRGAKNQDADTWVQLDPSFKQYEYLEGTDIPNVSGIDMEQLTEDIIASGTVNESEGWVTGFNPSLIEQAQAQATENFDTHITSLTDPTVGDVVGGRKSITKEYPTLPSSIPNRIIVEGARYDKLPTNLQQKVTFAFSRDILGELEDPITFPWAQLNSRKVTLSSRPATEIDEQALISLVPEGVTEISQLPASIPSYLVNVVPELRVGGEVVKSGSYMRLGEELGFTTSVDVIGRGQVPARSYSVVAGSYLNVNVFAGSISPIRLSQLQTRLESTQAILDSEDNVKISSLKREELIGEIFHAAGMGYYEKLLRVSHAIGIQKGGHYQLAVGLGTIGLEPDAQYLFGTPVTISQGGIGIDIPMNNVFGFSNGDSEKKKQYTQQVGIISSALEHFVLEQIFSSNEENSEAIDAISAVKALQKASNNGQRIYQIDQSNMSNTLPLINSDSATLAEIQSAVLVGKTVTTHTDPVFIPGGWSGFGYIIIDPDTGDGAYKISGGINGGELTQKEKDILGVTTTLNTVMNVFSVVDTPSLKDAHRNAISASITNILSAIVSSFITSAADSIKDNAAKICLTEDQAKSIANGMVALLGLTAIGISGNPVAGAAVILGQAIGFALIAATTKYFIRQNRALGEC